MAIAHKVLTVVHRLLSTGEEYKDLGEAYLDHLGERRVTANLVRRLERLGYQVQIAPREATAPA